MGTPGMGSSVLGENSNPLISSYYNTGAFKANTLTGFDED
jgi:hypothetical protein